MAQNGIDFSTMTVEQLDAVIQQAQQAKAKPEALKTMTLIGAFLEVHKRLVEREADNLSEQITGISQQAMPKPKVFARRADLSETEMHNALEKGRKAVAGL